MGFMRFASQNINGLKVIPESMIREGVLCTAVLHVPTNAQYVCVCVRVCIYELMYMYCI